MDKQQREYIHHLMLQYSDAMVRLTYRRVGDWHLAEDLVQETFLTACCKSERVSVSGFGLSAAVGKVSNADLQWAHE